jgi:pyrroloquinoline quinone biosynthesis protein B
VLGTAQDAGVPQVNCFNPNCTAVRSGARPAPRVASLGLIDPGDAGSGATHRFLIDATPDFVAQVGDLLGQPDGAGGYSGSIPLAEHLHGVLLTHAHMGHYTGLVHLGREGAAAHELPLYVSRTMAGYLSGNEPWAMLVRNGHVAVHDLQPGVRVALSPRLAVTPFEVLHRQELSDTLGFLIHGPRRTLLYVPDADRWEGWPRTGIEAEVGDDAEPFDYWLAQSDVALLDAAFYSYDELGHRPQGEVPHPPVVESMERIAGRLGDLEVWFTHLNNTNPLWNPDSPENPTVRARGFGVAASGQVIAL